MHLRISGDTLHMSKLGWDARVIFIWLICLLPLTLFNQAAAQTCVVNNTFVPCFQHTPIIDGNDAFNPGPSGLYKGTYYGHLYGHWFEGFSTSVAEGTNGVTHDTDGRSKAASKIKPLCLDGTLNCQASLRRIVVLGIGFSNWTKELCGDEYDPLYGNFQVNISGAQNYPCTPNGWSFINTTTSFQGGINPAVRIVDCAIAGAVAKFWQNNLAISQGSGPNQILNPPPVGLYNNCIYVLSGLGLSALQVQVVLFKDADSGQSEGPGDIGLTELPNSGFSGCNNANPTRANGDPDACVLIHYVANIARLIKHNKSPEQSPGGYFPNTQMMFVHSRTYGGYADKRVTMPYDQSLNPEPFAYEQGFAMKWLIQSQIDEVGGLAPLAAAGTLDYRGTGLDPQAPWIDWGPYLWAGQDPGIVHTYHSYPAPCQSCVIPNLTWIQDVLGPANGCTGNQECDFQKNDNTHPSYCGRDKVAKMLLRFYCGYGPNGQNLNTSPYTIPWFGANGAFCSNPPSGNDCTGFGQGPD